LVSASGYYNRQSDLLITAQSEAPETVIAQEVFADPAGMEPRRLARSINLGSSQALGFDLFARFNTTSVSAWASYSYVHFRRTLGGRVSGLDQISRHNVRAGVTLTIRSKFSITPSVMARSTPENLPATYDNTGVSLEHPYQVDLAVLYSPLGWMDVFANVRNVTYNHYALRGVSGPALQEPLRAVGGLRLRY
jgi:hypothetical protein